MPQFKIKKINQTPVIKTQIPPPENAIIDIHNNKKYKIRKIMGIFIILSTIIFSINYVVNGVSNIRIGTAGDESSWIAPIFEMSGSTTPVQKGVTNILIAGIGGAGHQAGTLTDSIMLASLDAERGSVTMISIPRDLYVSYGSGTGAGKINTLYPIGLSQKEGVSLLAKKVSEVTGQSIHHYMIIDFTAFRYVVNALDGIEVDVERDLYDNEYPDYNYGYTVFAVKKGTHQFDGETALRYARSRHSTSDMDRSHRQQQIINAIKTKALSVGIITSPSKISAIIEATRSNIATDLTVGDIVSLGSIFAGTDQSDIHIYNLGDNCISYTNCSVGSYLYNPSMAYFGGAWAVIPEGAKLNSLSSYERIRRFVDVVFQFPGIHAISQPITIVHTSKSVAYARNLLMEMRKIGINYETTHALYSATGSIETSHINIYWNPEHRIGIDPTSAIIEVLKMLDMRIAINIVENNEYITTNGPRIEIVLGDDHRDYFQFAHPVSYLPKIESPSSSQSGSVLSGEQKKIRIPTIQQSTEKNLVLPNIQQKSPALPSPNEWENL